MENFDISAPAAVIGTNAWGSALYGKLVRGSYVEDGVIKQAMAEAENCGLKIYDLAQDYGLGKAQKMIGDFGTENIIISAKYTPFTRYKKGCVRKSLSKDLADFKRSYVDIYWLHLPTDITPHMKEMIELAKEGKIRHIGVSNFSLEECKLAKRLLEAEGLELYGVQNHYSVISREWEQNGLLKWCHDNGVSFWAWAVLEEGILTDPRVKTKKTLIKAIYSKQTRKLKGLYSVMIKTAEAHGISVPQVAMAFCANKGIVPLCGCRKPEQVRQLAEAVKVKLTKQEIARLEQAVDKANAKIMGPDLFRRFVKKG